MKDFFLCLGAEFAKGLHGGHYLQRVALGQCFLWAFEKISSLSVQKTVKTKEDAVPALSSFNATHFCGMQNRRTFPPSSEHQVMPTAMTGIEMLC